MRDLGGFSVARLLPSAAVRHVGPIVFFDLMGPAMLGTGPGNRRPAASAYRARDGDLSLRGRDRASGQPRVRAADRARRDQLDDGGPGHCALGAHRRVSARGGLKPAWLAALGRAAASARGDRAGLSAPSCRHAAGGRCRRGAFADSRGKRLRRRFSCPDALAADLCRGAAARGHGSRLARRTRRARRLRSERQCPLRRPACRGSADDRVRAGIDRRSCTRNPTLASCCLAARRSTANVIFGGTSCRAVRSG